MILIADSGSTKCDWLLIDPTGEHRGAYSTLGFNPYFHTTPFVVEQLRMDSALCDIAPNVEHVFFYGAGSSSPDLCKRIEDALQQVFSNAMVVVDHDLVGAAYAVYDGEPCIAAILGTGSNSCFFDGKEVTEEVPALAYILGDEGSGSWLGKALLRAYYYKAMPASMREDFERTYTLTKDDIVECVYNNPHANVWLASFAPFAEKHRDEPMVQDWVRDGFTQFVKYHICCYPNYASVKTHFVGSIAHHFEAILREVCSETRINIGHIVRKPVEALAEYHVKHLIPQLLRS
jgi:glucosamine kinase